MRNLLFLMTCCMIFILFSGCKEMNLRKLSNKGDGIPDQISHVEVENLHGSAKITYVLPKDDKLLYVKAVYPIKPGIQRETKASYYNDNLFLKGFSESKDYPVKLFSVSRGGNVSEPLTVTVHPLLPPYKQIFRSIKANADFGGILVNYKNKWKGKATIIVLKKDSIENFRILQQFFNVQDSGFFNVRGLQSLRTEFGIYVRDQYQNLSDTLFASLTPILEVELDKHKFSSLPLDGDSWQGFGGTRMEALWDGKISEGGDNIFNTLATGLPQWYTIDLGQKAVLSRFTMVGRPHWASYNRSYPKIFELWGSVSPNPNGEFDSTWFKYGTFVTLPPSGAEKPTNDEIENPTLPGQSFDIPNPSTHSAVKYIRIKCLTTWGGYPQFQIGEIGFYGQIK